MAKFAWRGIPIKNTDGNVMAVQPVRSIKAPDGLHYPGVLSKDAEGNAFTYNQVPDTDEEPPHGRSWFYLTLVTV